MEAVNVHFEGVKPRFDGISIGIVNPAAQSQSREASPITELIDEKLRLGEIVFLREFLEECSRRISAVPTE